MMIMWKGGSFHKVAVCRICVVCHMSLCRRHSHDRVFQGVMQTGDDTLSSMINTKIIEYIKLDSWSRE